MKQTQRWPAASSRSSPAASGWSPATLGALARATAWLNSRPLTANDLRGRVVLVDFGTYTCVNWLRTVPYVRAWQQKYAEHGLVVIGVHTPEFDFEHDLDNVRRAIAEIRIDHPVAVDNDYDIWTAFHNRCWPALYFADVQGQVREHHFGEGDYGRSEATIQFLLAEAGATGFSSDFVRVNAIGVEAAADWNNLWSPENYLGSERSENFASPNGAVLGTREEYAVPPDLPLNSWALAGNWTLTRQAVVLNRADGAISYRFHARDVNVVMKPDVGRVPFQIRIDGLPPGPAHGVDVDAEGNGLLDTSRLYQLVTQAGPVVDHILEITFRTAGAQVYALTFG